MTARRRAGLVAFGLVDVDCRLPVEVLRAWAEAATIQAQEDFARPVWGYGVGAVVKVRRSLADVRPGEVPALLMVAPDLPDAAGYHDGSRVVKVFPLLGDIADAPVTLTHEILERLADPDVSTAVIGPDRRVRLREVCDPVEAESYPVTLASGASVRVSNFVGVDWFSGPADGAAAAHLDAMRTCVEPCEIRPGGYQTFWTRGKGFTQEVLGAKRSYRAALDKLAAGGGVPTRAAMAAAVLARRASKAGDGWDGPRLVDRFGVEVDSSEVM